MHESFPLAVFLAALILCPLFIGVINRVKAIFAGRRGVPLLQLYYDLAKLSRKAPVYSTTATWLFRACPVAAAGGALAAALLTPMGAGQAVLMFQGDFLVWAGALAFARVIMILVALDMGSCFEGMGASREAWYGVLTEPALLLSLAALAVISRDLSLSGFFLTLNPEVTTKHFMPMLFAGLALMLVLVAENARIPVDDPATHLELTMIHEAMLLDHSGPDLAMIEYGSALKLWVMGALAVGTVMPVHMLNPLADAAIFLGGMFLLAILVGVVESTMARLKLARVPQFLVGATILASISLVLLASTQ